MQIFVTIKYILKFSFKYLKYIYYGLKQRLRSLFKLNISILDFFKSLIRLPFESWSFAKMEITYEY